MGLLYFYLYLYLTRASNFNLETVKCLIKIQHFKLNKRENFDLLMLHAG